MFVNFIPERVEVIREFPDGSVKREVISCGDYSLGIDYKPFVTTTEIEQELLEEKRNLKLQDKIEDVDYMVFKRNEPISFDIIENKSNNFIIINEADIDQQEEFTSFFVENKEVVVNILCEELFNEKRKGG